MRKENNIKEILEWIVVCVALVGLNGVFAIFLIKADNIRMRLLIVLVWVLTVGIAVICTLYKNRRKQILIVLFALSLVVQTAYVICDFSEWDRNELPSTNSVWNGNEQHYEALLYSILRRSDCVVSADSSIREYVEVFAKSTQTDASLPGKVEKNAIYNANDFVDIGRHWVSMFSMLISDDLSNMDQKDEEILHVFINPINFEQADRYIIFMDMQGDIYIENEEFWK